jgi:hypothetical protein
MNDETVLIENHGKLILGITESFHYMTLPCHCKPIRSFAHKPSPVVNHVYSVTLKTIYSLCVFRFKLLSVCGQRKLGVPIASIVLL